MQYSGTPGISTVRAFNPVTSGGAFTRPGLDTIGNVGRNTAWGRGFWTSNLSLMKNFAIKERINLQLRMDAYNALNHINFGGPNGTIDSSNAGQIEGSVKYVLLLVVLVSCAAQSPAQSSAATSATATQPTPASIRRLIDTGHPDDALAAVDRLHAPGSCALRQGRSSRSGRCICRSSDDRSGRYGVGADARTHPLPSWSARRGHPSLERSRSFSAKQADPNYVLGLWYMDTRRWDDARKAFSAQFRVPPDSAAGYLVAARLLLRRDYLPISEQFAHKALEIAPSIPLAHELLGELALAGGHMDLAITELEAERARNPMEGAVYDRLGDAYLREGKLDDASRVLQQDICWSRMRPGRTFCSERRDSSKGTRSAL
jgi:tetratricopeptide (TPR) repeat protein